MNNINLVLETVQASSLIGRFVKLKQLHNRTYIGLCPFHNEKTPSFRVDDEKKFFYCFGCHKGGNVLNFLQDFKNISFGEAITEIANSYGITLQKFNKDESEKTKDEKSLMQKIAELFTSQLKTQKGREALLYLKNERALTEQTIADFQIGFCPKEGDFLLSYFPEKTDAMLRLGLIGARENGGFYSTFAGRIMFPIFNYSGEIIAFAGRIFEKNQEKTAKYINSKESHLFKKNITLYGIHKAKKAKSPLVLVEGYLDVIKMHQFGFNSAVAQMGTALSKENLNTLFSQSDEIIFCYDSDEAGKKAEIRSLELCLPLLNPQKKVSFIELETKDADEFLEQNGKEEMAKKIAQRVPLFDKIFSYFSSNIKFENPNESALCESNLMDFCNKITDAIVRKSYQSYFKNKLFTLRTSKKIAKKEEIVDSMELSPRDGTLFALFLKFPDFFKQDYYFEHFVPFEMKKLEKIVKGEEIDLKLAEKVQKLYPLKNVNSPREIFDKIYNDFIVFNLLKEKTTASKAKDFNKVKQINTELLRLKNGA